MSEKERKIERKTQVNSVVARGPRDTDGRTDGRTDDRRGQKDGRRAREAHSQHKFVRRESSMGADELEITRQSRRRRSKAERVVAQRLSAKFAPEVITTSTTTLYYFYQDVVEVVTFGLV